MAKTSNNYSVFTFSSKLWFNPRAISATDATVSLYLQVYIGTNGKRETSYFKLNLRWPVDKVDKDASAVLSRYKDDPDFNDYNLIILNERAKHNEIAKTMRLANVCLSMEKFTKKLHLFDYRHSFVTYMERTRRLMYRKKEISESSWKNVGSTINSLKEYHETVRFDEIDVKWMKSYKSWLMHVKRNKIGTAWGRLKDVKHYLNLALDEKTIYVDPDAASFPNNAPPPVTTYLNQQELKRMIKLQEEHLSSLEMVVLKAFLFTCFTSLRISDLYKAGKGMLISETMLSFTATKNARNNPKQITIPLIPIARALINESLNSFFELPTEQDYNRKLKVLARKAKINKKLTSHVGRHTYGYLYMTTIGNLYGLKEILGHSKIETTQRYAHIDDEYQMKQALLMQKGFENVIKV